MLEQLRDSYIVYKERCSRCRVQLREKCKHLFSLLSTLKITVLSNVVLFEFKRRGGRAIQEILFLAEGPILRGPREAKNLPQRPD